MNNMKKESNELEIYLWRGKIASFAEELFIAVLKCDSILITYFHDKR